MVSMVVAGAALALGLMTGGVVGGDRDERSAPRPRSDSYVTESVDELRYVGERPVDVPGPSQRPSTPSTSHDDPVDVPGRAPAAVVGRLDAVIGRRTPAVVGLDSALSGKDCRRSFLALRMRW